MPKHLIAVSTHVSLPRRILVEVDGADSPEDAARIAAAAVNARPVWIGWGMRKDFEKDAVINVVATVSAPESDPDDAQVIATVRGGVTIVSEP